MTLALVAAGFSTYALLYCVQPLLPVFIQTSAAQWASTSPATPVAACSVAC